MTVSPTEENLKRLAEAINDSNSNFYPVQDALDDALPHMSHEDFMTVYVLLLKNVYSGRCGNEEFLRDWREMELPE